MRLLSVNKFFLIVMAAFFLSKVLLSWLMEGSPISVTIQMGQRNFMLPEPIEGKVIVITRRR